MSLTTMDNSILQKSKKNSILPSKTLQLKEDNGLIKTLMKMIIAKMLIIILQTKTNILSKILKACQIDKVVIKSSQTVKIRLQVQNLIIWKGLKESSTKLNSEIKVFVHKMAQMIKTLNIRKENPTHNNLKFQIRMLG